MHNLVIDIGNTNSKLAVFEQRKLVHYERFESLTKDRLTEVLTAYPMQNFTISSVRSSANEYVSFLSERLTYHPFSSQVMLGIKNQYETLDTLGLDRWAKVVAAHRLYPHRDCLIIDAGTCITYDYLSADQVYTGGSISLGISMRFEALHHFTGKLPLVAWDSASAIPLGVNTQDALRNGVLQGTLHEIKGFISAENARKKSLLILLTGGDADFLMEQLKNSIFASQITHDPYLVLKGLNEVITL